MGVVTVQGGGVANVLSQSTHTTLNGRRDRYEAARITWLGVGVGLGLGLGFGLGLGLGLGLETSRAPALMAMALGRTLPSLALARTTRRHRARRVLPPPQAPAQAALRRPAQAQVLLPPRMPRLQPG